MLTLKNLVKTYKTKGGEEVRALDGISIDFPEKGMVFLLGKSGSGKSTLLNVAGGLDIPDEGEIILNGTSSKNFTQTDFDSYRNTYIGFIFQEYNILNEFNIEQNLALALQLQNKPSDKQAIEDILAQVDLSDMGKRKPSTLSGGQKQRIAIARALIKNPQIIMADEPTGALDSKTGNQVFETLKKLSENKLVIVVSHDRDFAEKFGDRIIELKDGKIIHDYSKTKLSPVRASDNLNFIGDDVISVKNPSSLSDEDAKLIIQKLRSAAGESLIAVGEKNLPAVKKACRITDDGTKESFKDTDIAAAAKNAEKKTDGAVFIKSHLPLRHALKLGLGSMKVKPFRLVLTVLLLVIAFGMFGVGATLVAFDPVHSVGVALTNSVFDNVKLNKNYSLNFDQYYIDVEGKKNFDKNFSQEYSAEYGVNELKELNARSSSLGLDFAGVSAFGKGNRLMSNNAKQGFSFYNSIYSSVHNEYYRDALYGFSDCGEEYLSRNGFNIVAGHYPETENEIMLSEYIYECIKTSGLKVADENNFLTQKKEISSPQDLLNEELKLSWDDNKSATFIISGIVNTGSLEQFARVQDPILGDSTDLIGNAMKYTELVEWFSNYIENSFHTIGFVSPKFFDIAKEANTEYQSSFDYTPYIQNVKADGAKFFDFTGAFDTSTGEPLKLSLSSSVNSIYSFSDMAVKAYPDGFTIYKTDGANIEKLNSSDFSMADDEFYLSLSSVNILDFGEKIINSYEFSPETLAALFHIANYNREMIENPADGSMIKNPYYRVSPSEEEMKLAWKAVYGLIFKGEQGYYSPYFQNAFSRAFAINERGLKKEFRLAGFFLIDPTYGSGGHSTLLPLSAVSELSVDEKPLQSALEVSTEYVPQADGRYESVMTVFDKNLDQAKFLLGEDKHYGASYVMENKVYDDSRFVVQLVGELEVIFLAFGGTIGVLAALMLFNFITVSMSYRKKEIGILRAVGARGLDVFKIFFAEGGFIALICFILSSVASFIMCGVLNERALQSSLALELLNYGILQIAAVFIISFTVSLIATAIPVYFAAKKPPVESIREL